MAEPPQIDDPTPTKIETFLSIFSTLHMIKATIRDVSMVAIIMGKLRLPTEITILIFRVNPKMMTAHCSIFLEVNVTPCLISSLVAKAGNMAVTIIPIRMAKTGAPITSKEKFPILKSAKNVDMAATITAKTNPFPLFLIKFIVPPKW
jgi:hypothetical protein